MLIIALSDGMQIGARFTLAKELSKGTPLTLERGTSSENLRFEASQCSLSALHIMDDADCPSIAPHHEFQHSIDDDHTAPFSMVCGLILVANIRIISVKQELTTR